MDSPIIEGSLAETVAAVITSHTETVPATMISTGETTVDTPTLSGNDCKNLAINFSYTVPSFFNSKNPFAKTLALTVSTAGPSQEEVTSPMALDSAGVIVLYHSIIQG